MSLSRGLHTAIQPPHPCTCLSLPPPAFSSLQKCNLFLRKQIKTTPISALHSPYHPDTTVSFQSLFPLSSSTPLWCAGPWNVTTSCTLSSQLSDHEQRWKKLTQTKCQPKYCPNSMTFRYIDNLSYYCLLPVLFTLIPSACKTAACSSWGRLVLQYTNATSEKLFRDIPAWISRNPSTLQKATRGMSSGQGQEVYIKLISDLKSTPFPALLYLSSGAVRFRGRLLAVSPVQGKFAKSRTQKSCWSQSGGVFNSSLQRSCIFQPFFSVNIPKFALNFSSMFEWPDVASLTL